jgi:hypothetical protein
VRSTSLLIIAFEKNMVRAHAIKKISAFLLTLYKVTTINGNLQCSSDYSYIWSEMKKKSYGNEK